LKKFINFTFNTIAQVDTGLNLPKNNTTKEKQKLTSLQKRARSKFLSDAMIKELHKLDSPIKSSYGRSLGCCETINVSEGIAYGKYCKNRYCLVCSRIKTAVLCSKYKETISENFKNPYFVTLTVKNVKAESLEGEIKRIQGVLLQLQRKRKTRHQRGKVKTKFKAIAKVECTYNQAREDFHPHLHLIVEGLSTAKYIVKEWLQRNTSSREVAQDYRKADTNSLMEIFKYSTKLMSDIRDYERGKKQGKGELVIEALDVMFRALHRKRTLRTYGFKLKIKEDFTEEDLKGFTEVENEEGIYNFIKCDWVNKKSGEMLTNWEPGKKEEHFRKSIKVIGKKFLPKYADRTTIIDLLESYRLKCGFRSYNYLTGYLIIHNEELRSFEITSYEELKRRGFDDDYQKYINKLHRYLDKFQVSTEEEKRAIP
jgi:hypothetical protein